MEAGLLVPFAGWLTIKNAGTLREIAATGPLDRLLVETDAPYLSPEPKRGKKNEPAHVVHTAAKLAEVKGVSDKQIAQITTENFHRLFSTVPAPAGAAAQ